MKKLFKRKTVAAVRFLAVVMVLISIALSEMPAYAAETEMGDAFYGNTVIGINAGTSFAAKANTTRKKPGSKKAFLADPRYDDKSPWGYSKRPIYSPAAGIGMQLIMRSVFIKRTLRQQVRNLQRQARSGAAIL